MDVSLLSLSYQCLIGEEPTVVVCRVFLKSDYLVCPVTVEKDHLTTEESPCDGVERQLAGDPHWDSHGLAAPVCSLACLAAC